MTGVRFRIRAPVLPLNGFCAKQGDRRLCLTVFLISTNGLQSGYSLPVPFSSLRPPDPTDEYGGFFLATWTRSSRGALSNAGAVHRPSRSRRIAAFFDRHTYLVPVFSYAYRSKI